MILDGIYYIFGENYSASCGEKKLGHLLEWVCLLGKMIFLYVPFKAYICIYTTIDPAGVKSGVKGQLTSRWIKVRHTMYKNIMEVEWCTVDINGSL